MMRIESVASQSDRAGRHAVRFEDGTVMHLYPHTIQDFYLYSGKELTDEELTSLRDAAGAMSAKMRAVRILSATSVSKKDLEQRLVQKGEDPRQAKEAVAWMEELSLVDDAKTAEQVVHRCISKGYGLARAKQALYEKRIPKDLWEDALADYPDMTDAITTYLRSHLQGSADQKQQKKAVDALLRRGHSYSQISRALRALDFDTDEFPEEL